jgi:DNA-directed RNA polymerase specialized sigma54-like protein
MNKPQPIHQALQTIDDINAFIQTLRAATHEDDIKTICDSQIAYILSQGMAKTIAQRTVSRYRSVVAARLGKNHLAVTLMVWQSVD